MFSFAASALREDDSSARSEPAISCASEIGKPLLAKRGMFCTTSGFCGLITAAWIPGPGWRRF